MDLQVFEFKIKDRTFGTLITITIIIIINKLMPVQQNSLTHLRVLLVPTIFVSQRHYGSSYPPKHLQLPPDGGVAKQNAAATWLCNAFNEVT
jgi:hypothetical protein